MNLFLDGDIATKQTMLESLGIATCLVEKRGDTFILAEMNDRYREYYGFPPGTRQVAIDAKNLDRATATSEKLFEPIAQRLQMNAVRCIITKEPILVENVTPQFDGSEKWSRDTISPVLRDGQVDSLIVSVIDITELMNTQQEIEANLVSLIGRHVRVCRGCTRIQGDNNEWLLLENYMQKSGEVAFSHGICPSCKAEII
ncbi:MAG: hypothetical protein WDZ52_01225 [Pseudohongiellaceae bacterium]